MCKKILKQIIAIILILCVLTTSAPTDFSVAEAKSEPVEERSSMDDVTADSLVEDTFAVVSKKWEDQGYKIKQNKAKREILYSRKEI